MHCETLLRLIIEEVNTKSTHPVTELLSTSVEEILYHTVKNWGEGYG